MQLSAGDLPTTDVIGPRPVLFCGLLNGEEIGPAPTYHMYGRPDDASQWGLTGGTPPLGNEFNLFGPSRHLSASHAASWELGQAVWKFGMRPTFNKSFSQVYRAMWLGLNGR